MYRPRPARAQSLVKYAFFGRVSFAGPSEPNERLPTPRNIGLWGLVEVGMTTLFSFAFGGIFIAFLIAAVVGHVLVIEALVRPFFGRLTLTSGSTVAKNSLLPRPAH